MAPENVGVTLLIDGSDFSFLMPAQLDGEFATIASLVAIYERRGEGPGKVSDAIIDRYRRFFTSVYALMTELAKREATRLSIAS
jgi:hypothetical protein